MVEEATVDTESAATKAMKKSWTRIDDILAGAERVREKGELYLPKYVKEPLGEYNRRKAATPWRPEFADSLTNLAAKPFSRDVALQGTVSGRIKEIAEDVDGRGNNMHVFAGEVFYRAIGYGLHAILVDFPSMRPNATVADEKELNARPYWVQVHAKDILALYTRFEGAKEIIAHVRFKECSIARDGFDEKEVERIRVMEPGLWQLWEKQKHENDDKPKYYLIEKGTIDRRGKEDVPLVLFFTGERKGALEVKPPLDDLADMQIELYQALSRLEEILTFAGAPMLSGNGLAPPPPTIGPNGENIPGAGIDVGPRCVLYAPPAADGGQTSWSYVQPDAANIKEMREDKETRIADMKRLGMQPLARKSGTPTATGESIEAAKAHSAVQRWAIGLKDALEQALVFTAEMLGESTTAEVSVNTDWAIDVQGAEELRTLVSMRNAGDISRDTLWDEMTRRNVLGPEFDSEQEAERIDEEAPALGMIAPALGGDAGEENDATSSGGAS